MKDNVDSALNMKVTTDHQLGVSSRTGTFADIDPRPLQELLGLTTSSACNVVFIAIDFENIDNIRQDLSRNLNSEVGLAILDTRDLDCVESTELISSYNFASGRPYHQRRATKRFLFGNTVAITQDKMLQNIKSLIPKDRQVIFVGHAIHNDLQALKMLGFDFLAYNMTVLDTQKVSVDTISWASTSLRRLLIKLGCPFQKLHCGGNDANFTLKALLLLAIRDCVVQTGVERRLAVLKDIALRPLPCHVQLQSTISKTTSILHEASQIRTKKKSAKSLERNRKRQSMFLDHETRDKIRAERAAKRNRAESQPAPPKDFWDLMSSFSMTKQIDNRCFGDDLFPCLFDESQTV